MPYAAAMAWEIELTAQAEAWFMALDADDADRIAAAIDELQRQGPALGRPFVDSIKGSRHHNMKELRSIGGHLRALFASDPGPHSDRASRRRQDQRLDRLVRAQHPNGQTRSTTNT